MNENEFGRAIRTFDSALEILRWLPYHAPKRQFQEQLEELKESLS